MSSKEKSNGKSASIRARLKYATEADFIAKYAPNISRAGIFVKTQKPREQGTRIKFEFQLTDGQPVMRGLGEVVWIRDAKAGDAAPGMEIKFLKLDARSRKILSQVLVFKKEHNIKDDSGSTSTPPEKAKESAAPQKAKRSAAAGTKAAAGSTAKRAASRGAPVRKRRTKARQAKDKIDLQAIDSMLAEIATDSKTKKRKPARGRNGAAAGVKSKTAGKTATADEDDTPEPSVGLEPEALGGPGPGPEPAPQTETSPPPEPEPAAPVEPGEEVGSAPPAPAVSSEEEDLSAGLAVDGGEPAAIPIDEPAETSEVTVEPDSLLETPIEPDLPTLDLADEDNGLLIEGLRTDPDVDLGIEPPEEQQPDVPTRPAITEQELISSSVAPTVDEDGVDAVLDAVLDSSTSQPAPVSQAPSAATDEDSGLEIAISPIDIEQLDDSEEIARALADEYKSQNSIPPGAVDDEILGAVPTADIPTVNDEEELLDLSDLVDDDLEEEEEGEEGAESLPPPSAEYVSYMPEPHNQGAASQPPGPLPAFGDEDDFNETIISDTLFGTAPSLDADSEDDVGHGILGVPDDEILGADDDALLADEDSGEDILPEEETVSLQGNSQAVGLLLNEQVSIEELDSETVEMMLDEDDVELISEDEYYDAQNEGGQAPAEGDDHVDNILSEITRDSEVPPPQDPLLDDHGIDDALDDIFTGVGQPIAEEAPETLPDDAIPPGLVRKSRPFPPPRQSAPPVPPNQEGVPHPDDQLDEDGKKKGFFKKLFGG